MRGFSLDFAKKAEMSTHTPTQQNPHTHTHTKKYDDQGEKTLTPGSCICHILTIEIRIQ